MVALKELQHKHTGDQQPAEVLLQDYIRPTAGTHRVLASGSGLGPNTWNFLSVLMDLQPLLTLTHTHTHTFTVSLFQLNHSEAKSKH